MRCRITILYFFIINSIFCQDFTIKYQFQLNRRDDIISTTRKFTLKQNENSSIFEIDDIYDINQFKNAKNTFIASKNDSICVYFIDNVAIYDLFKEKYFKDFSTNTQIVNDLFSANEMIYIKEKINMFDWEILSNEDTLIAGYKCKKAITSFRGREYEAFFTNEIANQGGPWKFDGLPGFILSVKSKDGYLILTPYEIKINKKNSEINNPFKNVKTVSFNDLKDLHLEKGRKSFLRSQAKENPPIKITISKPDMIEDIGIGEQVYE